MTDRVGIGWRPELAAGIMAHLDRIDVLEVIADDWFDAPPARLRALRTLARQTQVHLHGVSLGMASTVPVDEDRLGKFARLAAAVEPECWSEHLAFVRGGGIEIGHLAAPPRTAQTIEGIAMNVQRAREIVGAAPLLENVATLIDPPGSRMDEVEWLNGAISATGGDLLLDLHNLHANASNFSFDARDVLRRLPLERVATVHIAGGIQRRRLIDDHLHDVPDPVYDLLSFVAGRSDRPLTVILERDGCFPPIEDLLGQLDRARAAIAAGRSARELAGI